MISGSASSGNSSSTYSLMVTLHACPSDEPLRTGAVPRLAFAPDQR
jgi:hypothetical protein